MLPAILIGLNGEWLNAFLLLLPIKQGCPFLPFLLNRVLEVLPSAIDKKRKMSTDCKGRKKNIFR